MLRAKGMAICLLVSSTLQAAPAAASENVIPGALLTAKSLRCYFDQGMASSWNDGTPEIKEARFDAYLHFDAIDLQAGKARLIGNAGASDIGTFVNRSGLHFLEQTPAGNIMLTTVFPWPVRTKKDGPHNAFIAVTSRHVEMSSGPLPSQYNGTCEIWQ